MSAAVRDDVRKFIAANFYIADETTLVDSESLLNSGTVDSTGVLEVIGFLEEKFKIQVADEEMVAENLDTVDNIVAYVLRKQP